MPNKFDVTGVSDDRQYVPLIADAPEDVAQEIAKRKSMQDGWSAVLVKDNDRGGLIAHTYVNGKRQPLGF
jgi:hypothetical protein